MRVSEGVPDPKAGRETRLGETQDARRETRDVRRKTQDARRETQLG